MSAFRSKIVQDESFLANAADLKARTEDIRTLASSIQEGGGARAKKLHESRGKLFVRDRIQLLLDPGSPFLETGLFTAHQAYDFDVPSGGI
ncbi:MAG TPA: hypothetical protein PLD60_10380, partial [Leptospiraceae bacterium]|nr:hypothetical protein [Leptospiraceae bacterium]